MLKKNVKSLTNSLFGSSKSEEPRPPDPHPKTCSKVDVHPSLIKQPSNEDEGEFECEEEQELPAQKEATPPAVAKSVNPLTQLLLSVGAGFLFTGLILLIHGMNTPAWSVHVNRKHGRPQKISRETIHYSPWKICDTVEEYDLTNLKMDGIGDVTGKCEDIYIASYCNDDDFMSKCTKYKVVIFFSNFGVIIGIIALYLAIASIKKTKHKKILAFASTGMGLAGCLCVVTAVSVWSSIHSYLIESVEIEIKKEDFGWYRFSYGHSFTVTISGGIMMAAGAMIGAFGVTRKEGETIRIPGKRRIISALKPQKPLKRTFLLAGAGFLCVGVMFLITGMRTPAWSVESSRHKMKTKGRELKPERNYFHSPWKECTEDPIDKDDGKGVCNDVVISKYCRDDGYEDQCNKYNSVRLFANAGVILGIIASILALGSSQCANLNQVICACLSVAAGIAAVICVLLAVFVWSGLHADAKSKKEARISSDVKLTIETFTGWSFTVGFSFVCSLIGGVIMAVGVLLVGSGLFMSIRERNCASNCANKNYDVPSDEKIPESEYEIEVESSQEPSEEPFGGHESHKL